MFSKQTANIQKKKLFKQLLKIILVLMKKKAKRTFMEIQENLNTMIEEHNSIYDNTDAEPITLTQKDIQNLLIESGVPEEATAKIEKSYVENFGDDLPLAENLIDSKILKANAQIKKEEQLKKQVEALQLKLEQVTQDNEDNESSPDSELNDDTPVSEKN